MPARTTPSKARAETAWDSVPSASWMPRRRTDVTPGRLLEPIAVPVTQAQRLLREVARQAADLPIGSSDVVWTQGADRLMVQTAALTLTCHAGLLVVGVPVACDQLPVNSKAQRIPGLPARSATVKVHLAVGTRTDLRGLLMSALPRPQGPAVVVDGWADAITAFAWESVLTLAMRLAAQAGADSSSRPLVPGAIGSESQQLLVRPGARP